MKQPSESVRGRINTDSLAVLALIGIGGLFFADLLFSSKNFYFRDILNFHYPLRKVLIDSYARGELPLWNPFIYLGQPMLANPNYMALYPTNLLHLLLPFNYAFKLHFIIHPILAGLGSYFLSRRLGIAAFAAFTGALAYEFSGPVLSFLNLYNLIPAVALLPWIGWAFYGALKDRRLKRSFVLGALLAFQAVAFEPLLFQCELLLLAGLAALYLYETDNCAGEVRTVLKVSGLGGGFALGLAAIQIVPAIELFRLSARNNLDYLEASRWSAHPLDFLNTLIPNLFGNYYTIGLTDSWGDSVHYGREPYLVSLFLGSSTLLLAALSFAGKRRKLRLVLMLLTVISIFFALGDFNPAFQWLFEHIPLLSLGRYPSKYFLLGTLAICILASMGVEVLLEKKDLLAKRAVATAVLGLILAGALLAFWIYFGSHPDTLQRWLQNEASSGSARKDFTILVVQLRQSIFLSGIFLALGGLLVLRLVRKGTGSLLIGLLPLLVVAELFASNLRLSPLISDADVNYVPEVNRFIVHNGTREPFRVIPPTTLRPGDSLPTFNLRVPNKSSAWLNVFYKMSGRPFDGIANGIQYSIDRSVDNLNTQETAKLWKSFTEMSDDEKLVLFQKINAPFILSMEKVESERLLPIASFDTKSDMPVNVYLLRDTTARAYFATGFDFAESQEGALDKFLSTDFRSGIEVVLEGKRAYSPGQPGAGNARIIEYRNSRVSYDVQAKAAGYFVLMDSYYPGWKVFVDGREASILRANYAFRAVRVQAGIHRVVFDYRPFSVIVGFILSLLTILIGSICIGCEVYLGAARRGR